MPKTLEVVDHFYRSPLVFLRGIEKSQSGLCGMALRGCGDENSSPMACRESENKVLNILGNGKSNERSLRVETYSTMISDETKSAFYENLLEDSPSYCGFVCVSDLDKVRLQVCLSHPALDIKSPAHPSIDFSSDVLIELTSNRLVFYDTSAFLPRLLFTNEPSHHMRHVARVIKVHQLNFQTQH